jgi:hypothetical protein
MMGGGRMETETDEGNGQHAGSHTRMSGKVFGLRLHLDEVITDRTPPHQKVWETVGTPRLLVIGPYRLGFKIVPSGEASEITVFIEYALPSSPGGRLLGLLFGAMYAKWCVQQMVTGVDKRFVSGQSLAVGERSP